MSLATVRGTARRTTRRRASRGNHKVRNNRATRRLDSGVTEQRPIFCTLTEADMKDRAGAWQKLWASGLIRRERIPGGIRLWAEPGGAGALQQLIELERECCAWIDYGVVDGSSVGSRAAIADLAPGAAIDCPKLRPARRTAWLPTSPSSSNARPSDSATMS